MVCHTTGLFTTRVPLKGKRVVYCCFVILCLWPNLLFLMVSCEDRSQLKLPIFKVIEFNLSGGQPVLIKTRDWVRMERGVSCFPLHKSTKETSFSSTSTSNQGRPSRAHMPSAYAITPVKLHYCMRDHLLCPTFSNLVRWPYLVIISVRV